MLAKALRHRSRPRAVFIVMMVVAAFLPLMSRPGRAIPPNPPGPAGYWLVAADGGVFTYGDAKFWGSTGNIKLNQPVVGMASHPTGQGYWFVASDGGVFTFGDAGFFGSTGNIKLNKPIVGMAATPSGAGYWLVASDGGMFTFGDAGFHGSAAAVGTRDQIVGMVPTATGFGYWQMGAAGGVYPFGDAPALGFPTGLNAKVVGATGLAARLAPPPGSGGGPVPGPTGPTTPTTARPDSGLLTPAEKGRPNVLLVLMDDLRNPDIADLDGVLTKTKGWLTEGGTNYAEGYATTPLCCPERATIWSGRLSHNHGVADNDTGVALDKDWLIPNYLQDAGYRTSLVGKFITDWDGYNLDPWFDEYSVMRGSYRDERFLVKDPGDTEAHGERTSDPGVSESDDSTDFIKQKALGYIDAYETDDAQPWFMQISPHAPHDETTDPWFTWPERYNDVEVPARAPNPAFDLEGVGNPNGDDAIKTAKADKVSAIGRKTPGDGYAELMDTYHHGQLKTLLPADDMIDQVMRRLEANGELDNTLVIFTSDNGFSVGERVVDSKGWPYREHVSVPFWVRWPGVVPAGATDLRPVGGEDILPTLLDAAQYTPPTFGHPLDGRSFLPHQPAREFKYLEFGPGPGASDVTIDNYQGHRAIPTWAAIRTPEFHYIEYYEGTGEGDTVADHTTLRSDGQEYYDLTRDPWQLDNLLSEEVAGVAKPDPARIAELSRRLGELRRCAGTTGANPCP